MAKIYFAGCARDCEQSITTNILSLLALADQSWCQEIRIYIAENSSKDNTREVILRLAKRDPRVIPVLLDDLDKMIPVREARIAYCRECLLNEVRKSDVNGLYIPIDLDLDIRSLLSADAFRHACELVTSGKCTAIFPSSRPHYYDIHALRAKDWCPGSCWKEIQDFHPRGYLLNAFACFRYISLRQKSLSRLQASNLIAVDSAFGGAGIYSLNRVVESNAHYVSPSLQDESLKLCEHVVFNSFLGQLFIKSDWVITAPQEHIQFWRLPWYHKAWTFIDAALLDSKSLIRRIIRQVMRFIGVK
jgi:hypothetical protein